MQKKETVSMAEVLGLSIPKEVTLERFTEKSQYVPDIIPYEFRKEIARDVYAWLKHGGKDGMYAYGPPGAGKTSFFRQLAARLNIPVQQMTFNGRTELSDAIGHLSISKEGGMHFVYGPLAIAMKHGHWFIANEIDVLNPAVATGLNDVLDGAPLTIPENGGEVVTPHPDFRFIATANTTGSGEAKHIHAGTLRQNQAFMDRFFMMEVPYMNKDDEIKLVEKALAPIKDRDVRNRYAEKMVEVAQTIRDLFLGNNADAIAIDVTMGTRALLRWANYTMAFHGAGRDGVKPYEYALDRALLNRATPETREAVKGIVQRIFG